MYMYDAQIENCFILVASKKQQPAVAPDATVHAAEEPLTSAGIIPAIREEVPHLPTAISTRRLQIAQLLF